MHDLLISEVAAAKLRYAAEAMPDKEVSGFGKVLQHDGYTELIDIVIPPQVVGGAHVDIGPEVRDAFFTAVVKNGCDGLMCERTSEDTMGREVGWVELPTTSRVKCTARWCEGKKRATMEDPEDGDTFCGDCYQRWVHLHDERCNAGDIKDWRVWWHKHPGTMKPRPSGVDTNTLEELAGPKGFGYGWMLGVIISADASNVYCWMENANGPWSLTQEDIGVRYAQHEFPALKALVDRQMAHVKVQSYSNTTPTGGYQHRNGYQRPNSQLQLPVGQRSDTGPSLVGVKSIEPSTRFPGNIEIVKDDGTVIITRDRGQTMADVERLKRAEPEKVLNGKKAGDRAPKTPRRTIAKHVTEEGIRWVGLGTAAELRARDGTVCVGFDLEGAPCMEGEERHVYFTLSDKLVGIVAGPEIRQQGGADLVSDVDKDIIVALGDQFIGFDCAGTPLHKGEERHICYDSEGKSYIEGMADLPLFAREKEDDDQPRGDLYDAAYMAALRAQYLMPTDVSDEDALSYAMMMGGV